jgi:hypothetical protein
MLDKRDRLTTILLESSTRQAQEHVARAPERVLVASPYLTSDTAETVIGSSNPDTAIILTTFRAKTFADGASSLHTLRKLVERGFHIRYLDGLHAKFVITSQACLIGSQNLTFAGTLNKEVTAIIANTSVAAEAREALTSWLELSRPVTLKMIDEMEILVAPLLDKVEELVESTSAIDETVRNAEAARDESRRRLKQEMEEEERERRRAELLAAIGEAYGPLRASVRKAPIQDVIKLSLQQHGKHGNYTLIAPQRADLTQWSDGALSKRWRYLVIAPEIGKLGWPALNKTRLTRFGDGLVPSSMQIRVGSRSWSVKEITFNQRLETLTLWNVHFRLRFSPMMADVDLRTKFTLERLQLVDVSEINGDTGPEIKTLIAELSSEFDTFSFQLCRELLRPFQYKKNRRGISADRFCEGLCHNNPKLKLRSYAGWTFFSLECD